MFDMHIMNGRFPGDSEGDYTCLTQNGCSAIDYGISSSGLFSQILDFGLIYNLPSNSSSAHLPIYCNIETIPSINKEVSNLNSRIKYQWDPNMEQVFLNRLLEVDFSDFILSIDHSEIDGSVKKLNSVIQNCASEMKHTSRPKGISDQYKSTQPAWWDDELQDLKVLRNYWLNKFRKCSMRLNLNNFLQAKKDFKKMYNIKADVYFKELNIKISDYKNNSKKFWNLVKKVNGTNQNSNAQIQITPNNWFDYFKQLLNTEVEVDPQYDNEVNMYRSNHDINCINCDMNIPFDLNCNFTLEEIICFVKKLPNRKACGIEGICNEILKAGINILAPHLQMLFNKILETGEYPTEWCKAILVPVHKSGSRSDESNYRGISIVPCISKVFTGILNDRLSKWAESNQKLYETQAGFREGRSTIDHLFTFQAMVQKYLSKKCGRFYCVYVDFSKAFDRVPHSYLFARLLKNGIHGNLINVLKSMYSKLESCVSTPQGLTAFFDCLIGTRQGCMLSPLMFVLYLNQFIEMCNVNGCQGVFNDEEFPNVFLLLYADDMIQCADMVNRLQQQLNVLSEYCNLSCMKVNLKKTKIMVFRRGGIVKQNETWYYNNEKIDIVTYYKYLGLIVSSRLNWSKATQTLATQSEKSLII